MVPVIALVMGAWLAVLARMHGQGLGFADLSRPWFLLLMVPAIALPVFGSMPGISKRLVEPAASTQGLWAIAFAAGVALAFIPLDLLTWPLSVLVAVPSIQLSFMRWMCRRFVQRHGRLPADVPGPGPGLSSTLAYILSAWRYPREDLRYATTMSLASMAPFFLLLPFLFGRGA